MVPDLKVSCIVSLTRICKALYRYSGSGVQCCNRKRDSFFQEFTGSGLLVFNAALEMKT